MRLCILGAGAWGTALSVVLAPKFDQVQLWARRPDFCEELQISRTNATYLPGITLAENCQVTPDLKAAAFGADVVLMVVPSAFAPSVYERLKEVVDKSAVVVSAAKGFETETHLRLTEVAKRSLKTGQRIAVLGGPSFAAEVVRKEPAAIVVAADALSTAEFLQVRFSTPNFRPYVSTDVAGVEVAGAAKNVIAVAAGVVFGLGLGNNTMSALITRGLAEISRLAEAMGGSPKTMAGLAGLGDLVLTCSGSLSRNRRVGIELAKGKSISEILSTFPSVAEGIPATYATAELAHRHQVDMPITRQMRALLEGQINPEQAISRLMERELRPE
jgi:glycerol-3-phosphate dehydrogenase (NAD(P)+)